MSGGIIQLSFADEQNLYLNGNPKLNFFKKKYKKHTNFSNEIKEIKYSNSLEFNKKIEFNVKLQGDLLNDCYVEVDLPSLDLDDTIITNSNYTSYKSNKLSTINTKITSYKSNYDNLYNFCNIELIYYQDLLLSLESDNVTISNLQSKVTTLNITYSTDRNTYKVLIDSDLLNKINIADYILALTESEAISDVKTNLDNKKKIMEDYLNYYFSNYQYFQKKYDDFNAGKIYYSWSEYIGHYYFSNFEIELGGNKIDNYTSDFLHIYQSHNLNKSEKLNYNKMIGHEEDIYNFKNETRTSKKIYIPLIFWFNRNYENSLPLICSTKTEAKLNLYTNDLENIIYFKDWESDYNKLLIVDVELSAHSTNSNNAPIQISDLNIEKVELIKPEYIYRYHCTNINKKLLDLQFDSIESDKILENYGTLDSDGNYVLTLNNYIYLMKNIRDDVILTTDTKVKFAGYHYYVDYNYLINKVPKPIVKLYGNYIYLDELEKKKFLGNKLEYLVELFHQEDFDINDKTINTIDLDISRLIKNIYWFNNLNLIKEGIDKYNKKYNNDYTKTNIYNNNILEEANIIFNNFNFLKQFKNKNYYDKVLPYLYLNNSIPKKVNFFNFSLYPEKIQPSGSFNLIDINNKKVILKLNEEFLVEYYDDLFPQSLNPYSKKINFSLLMTSFNILSFDKGEGYLVFYHK